MSRRFRRFLFYLFVTIFLLIAPVIVLYAYGYKYDFERKKFIETGAFRIKTQPKRAKIYLNDKLLAKSTPVLIRGLLPHQYSLKIEIDGFALWNKDLEVYPGLVTKIENVLLFPARQTNFLLNEQPVRKFHISPDKERAALVIPIDDSGESIWVQELEKKSAAIQLVGNSAKTYENISWSENSKYFIFEVESQWFLIDIQKPSELINLSQILGNIEAPKWSTKDSDNLYFTREQQLFRFEWRSRSAVLLGENIVSYDIYNNQIYLTTVPNQLIYQANLNGGDRRQIGFNYPENFSVNRILVSSNGTVTILDSKNNLYLIEDGLLKLVAPEVKDIEFSSDDKKLLVRTNYELAVYYLDDIEGAPTRKKGEYIIVTRYSEPIKKAVWLPVNYEYIIFETDELIKIIETDNRDRSNTVDLVQGDNFQITFVDNNLNIYYINETGLNNIAIKFD